ASLLDGLRGGRWHFPDAAHLRAFLARVVLCRLYDRARSARTQTGREEPLGEFATLLPGPEPRPSEHAQAGAAWDSLLAACPPEQRAVLRLRRRGYSCGELGGSDEVLRRCPEWAGPLRILLDLRRALDGDGAPDYPEPGERLGEYRLLAELGRGRRGRVYLARQPALADRPVVLKLTPRGD